MQAPQVAVINTTTSNQKRARAGFLGESLLEALGPKKASRAPKKAETDEPALITTFFFFLFYVLLSFALLCIY